MTDTPHQPLELRRRPSPGLELEIEIERLDAKAFGWGNVHVLLGPQKLERHYHVKVREALPGERVRARVYRCKRRDLEAELLEILNPSPKRQRAECKHFGAQNGRRGCGGCILQMVEHAEQVALKGQFVATLFESAKLDPELLRKPLLPDSAHYYRNKMEFSFATTRDRPFALGLHPWGYHREVLPLGECLLLSELSSELLPRFAAQCEAMGLPPYTHRSNEGWLRTLTLREGKRTGERMAVLTTSDSERVATARGPRPAVELARELATVLREQAVALGGDITCIYWTVQHTEQGKRTRFVDTHLYGEAALHEELHVKVGEKERRLRFEIHPRAFFQPNTLQAEVLYATALEAAGLDNDGEPEGQLLDLYAGTGTIGLCAAPFCREVIGAELEPAAVENARRNALFNGIDNIRFFAGDVGKLLDGELGELVKEVSCVIIDPPRSGLAPAALQHIARIRCSRLVYVSCGPEALARDLVALRRFGLEPQYVQPVDMFPHTAHIENVALLERR